MCITSEDIRSQEEDMVWDILCHACVAKAEKLLDERKALRLFDIEMDEYGFCSECAAQISDAFEKLDELGEEIP